MFYKKLIHLLLALALLLVAAPVRTAAAQEASTAWPRSYFEMIYDETRGVIYGSDSLGNKIDVISPTTLTVLKSYPFPAGGNTYGIALSPDGAELAVARTGSANGDGSLAFLNLDNGQTIASLVPQGVNGPNKPSHVLYGRPGRLYSSGNTGGAGVDYIHIVDTTTHTEIARSVNYFTDAGTLRLSPDGNTLYVAAGGMFYTFDATIDSMPWSNERISRSDGFNGDVFYQLKDTNILLDGYGFYWNLPAGTDKITRLDRLPIPMYDYSITLLYSPQLNMAVRITLNGMLKFYNVSNNSYLGQHQVLGASESLSGLIDPTGKKLYVLTDIGLKLIDLETLFISEHSNMPNYVQDGGFEKSWGNMTYWDQISTHYGTPLCVPAICGNGGGTAGPRTGSTWIWFGNYSFYSEFGSVTQKVKFPPGTTYLRLYVWIGSSEIISPSADHYVSARLNYTNLFYIKASEISKYSTYKLVEVDVTPYADNVVRDLWIESNLLNNFANINVDDVSISQSSFGDVLPDHWAWRYVETLAKNRITSGCSSSPHLYCASGGVTRAEMAVFLLRGMHGSDYQPPAATGTVFDDVPQEYWSAAWIEQLYRDGITGGCGVRRYCPDSPVMRDQMAVFLLRAMHGADFQPPAATGQMFTDTGQDNWAVKWIEQLATEKITGGCAPGLYCPNDMVYRDQMAVFLIRAFGLK